MAEYDFKEKIAKRKALEQYPKRLEAFNQLWSMVDHEMDHAKGILRKAGWWVKWQGALLGDPHLTIDPEIPTACVMPDPNDGRIVFYFNVYFAATLSSGDIAFIMAHEIMHFMCDHLPQIKDYNIKYLELWNVVTDAFINEWLFRSLKWQSAALDEDKLDKMTKLGVRWSDIPKKVRDSFGIDSEGKNSRVDHSCIRIYKAMLNYFEEEGIDPNQFEEAVKNSRYGKYVKRRKRIEEEKRGSGEARETVYQKTYVVPGDVVWVKKQGKYGIIKDLRRTRDQQGEADIDVESTLDIEDWIRANRAVGVTTQEQTKSYANTRKIIDAYQKLRAQAEEPSWNDLAKLTGITGIAKLTQIDAAQAAYDAETIMTPEEVAAEELAKEQELVSQVQTRVAQRKAGAKQRAAKVAT